MTDKMNPLARPSRPLMNRLLRAPALRDALAEARTNPLLAACVGGLALISLFAVVRDLSLVPLHIPLSNNEGWNAYHADAAFGPALYPRPPSFLYNNYPPLSFLLAGALGRIIGDNIIAGRIIACLATAATAFAIAVTAREMKCGRLEAALAALLFLAAPWMLSEYAFYDDPQMSGQALGTMGFLLVVRRTERNAASALGALFLTLAEFTKHIFVAQPLALVLWLVSDKPRAATMLVAYCVLFGIAGVAAADFAYGTDLAAHIMSARVYDPLRVLGHPGTWLITEAVPLLAALLLFRLHGDAHARLCALYAAVAFALGVFFSGGEGVGGNAMFDASIAVALGTAVLVHRLRIGAARIGPFDAKAAGKIALASAVPMGIVLAANILAPGPWLFSLDDTAAKDGAVAHADIAFVADRRGPVLCEAMSLCYWARKPPQIDPFNLTQAFRRGARDPAEFTRLLDTHYFTTIELTGRSAFAYSPQLRDAFLRNYQIDHADRFGTFLVPRER